MKKSIIAVGILVALGAGWTIAEWQTGKKIEENKETYTQRANQHLDVILAAMASQYPDVFYVMPQLELTLADYDRGILSSTAKYYISETGNNNANERVYFTANIEHGPFPTSELSSFNLAPKGAVVSVEMDETELTKPIFALTKGKTPFVLNIIPGTQSTRGKISFAPIDFKDIVLEGVTLETVAAHDLSKFDINANIGVFNVDIPESALKVDSLNFTSDMKKGNFSNYIGMQGLNIKSISVHTKIGFPPPPEVRIENITSRSQIKEDTANVQYSFSMEFGSMKVANEDFGTLKFGADLSRISGQAFKQVMSELAEAAPNIENNPDIAGEIILNNLEGLLENGPTLKIAPVSWANKGGTSNYSALVEFNKIDLNELQNLDEDQMVQKALKNVNSELNLSIPMLKTMAVTVVQTAGVGTKADAEKQFDLSILMLPELLKEYDKNNMLVLNKDKIESKFNYSNGIVTLNGKQLPYSEFMQSFEVSE